MYEQSSFHKLIKHAWGHSAFYRELYQEAGIHENDLPHLSVVDLPLVGKESLMENFDRVVTDPRLRKKELLNWLKTDPDPQKLYLDEFTAMYSSGGSKTLAIAAYDRQAWRRATSVAASYLWPAQAEHGGMTRSAFFFTYKGHFASHSAAAQISSRHVLPLVLTMSDPLEEVLAQLAAFQPQRLTSYASGLAFLAGLALEKKLSIRPREVVVSGDRLTPQMEAQIREAWEADIFDIYAATESPYLAIRQPGNTYWTVYNELNLLECLDDEDQPVKTGQTGRAVLTNFYNYAIPLIRYELGDFLVPGESMVGHPTLSAVLGKMHEKLAVLGKDGRPGEIASHELARFHLPGIEMIQFVSHRPDYLEIEYRAKIDLDEPLRQAFAGFLATRGAQRTGFKVKRVENIWNSYDSSKLKLIRSPDDIPVVMRPSIPALAPGASRAAVQPQNAFTPFPKDLVESSISHCFELQAARCPDSVAIKDGPQKITYSELNRAANRLAHQLHTLGVGTAGPVALLFGHKLVMVTAMLGILKAGGFYLPLDPSFPARRNSSLLEDGGASLLLTDTEGLEAARACAGQGMTVINLDGIDPQGEGGNLELPISPDAPACILYTSGSTGKPRGVLLDQRAILHRVSLYTNDYHIDASDRLALIQLYTYNASTRDIYGALLNGAGLYPFDIKKNGLRALAQMLIDEGISVFYCVPGIFRVFLASLEDEIFKGIRLVRLGGERVLEKDVAGFRRHFYPGCILVNTLASTETETVCQYFMDAKTWIAGDTVPVGYPVSDKEICLLDESGRPVPDGTVGEIVVSSAYLGPGYWPEAVSQLHISRPGAQPATRQHPTGDLGFRLPDGRITLTGRKDFTVKINGHRVNTAEIEQLLAGCENIEQAVVVGAGRSDGGTTLAAYIQPKNQPAPSAEAIRKHLEVYLPGFMVPSVFMFLKRLPLTPGGKVDRQSLPQPEIYQANERVEFTSASTPVEEILAGIWKNILSLNQVGVDDEFFALGGDSLQIVTLMWQIEAKFGQRLPMSTLLENDTIRKLAVLLSGV